MSESITVQDPLGSLLEMSGDLSEITPAAVIEGLTDEGILAADPASYSRYYVMARVESRLQPEIPLGWQGVRPGDTISINTETSKAGGFADTIPGIITLSLLSAGLYDLIRSGAIAMFHGWLGPAVRSLLTTTSTLRGWIVLTANRSA